VPDHDDRYPNHPERLSVHGRSLPEALAIQVHADGDRDRRNAPLGRGNRNGHRDALRQRTHDGDRRKRADDEQELARDRDHVEDDGTSIDGSELPRNNIT
jgi:hypothetical protein